MHRHSCGLNRRPPPVAGFDAIFNGAVNSTTTSARACFLALFCPNHSRILRLTLRFVHFARTSFGRDPITFAAMNVS